jgi:hypothetical protein
MVNIDDAASGNHDGCTDQEDFSLDSFWRAGNNLPSIFQLSSLLGDAAHGSYHAPPPPTEILRPSLAETKLNVVNNRKSHQLKIVTRACSSSIGMDNGCTNMKMQYFSSFAGGKSAQLKRNAEIIAVGRSGDDGRLDPTANEDNTTNCRGVVTITSPATDTDGFYNSTAPPSAFNKGSIEITRDTVSKDFDLIMGDPSAFLGAEADLLAQLALEVALDSAHQDIRSLIALPGQHVLNTCGERKSAPDIIVKSEDNVFIGNHHMLIYPAENLVADDKILVDEPDVNVARPSPSRDQFTGIKRSLLAGQAMAKPKGPHDHGKLASKFRGVTRHR